MRRPSKRETIPKPDGLVLYSDGYADHVPAWGQAMVGYGPGKFPGLTALVRNPADYDGRNWTRSRANLRSIWVWRRHTSIGPVWRTEISRVIWAFVVVVSASQAILHP